MKRFSVIGAIALVLTACGDDDGSLDGGGVDDAGSENEHTPWEFTCPDVVEPSGTLGDLVGTWALSETCLGEDPLAPLQAICTGAVATDIEITETGGHVIIDDQARYITAFSFDSRATVFMPQSCARSLADGTCGGIEMYVNGLLADLGQDEVGITCSLDTDGADCLCDVVGTGRLRSIGTIASDGDGTARLVFFGDAGGVVEQPFEYAVDGPSFDSQFILDDNVSSYATTRRDDASSCEIYCEGFLAHCNRRDDVTAYEGMEGCMSRCATFPIAGSEATTGDSVECRIHHMWLASDTSDASNPATHCPHAQADPTEACVD